MLVTKEQGIACRKAAEYIAAGEWDGKWVSDLGGCITKPLDEIGWCRGDSDTSYFGDSYCGYDQSEVPMALLWCAEIAGEE